MRDDEYRRKAAIRQRGYRARKRALNPPKPRVFPSREPFDRFMEKVSIREGRGDECWVWTASFNANGYGQILFAGRVRQAPRVALALFRGFDVNSPLHVLHRCDNRSCVNPDHLWLGTNADNMRDRDAKSRQARGSQLPHAKLHEQDIPEIRGRLARGETVTSVARIFGVARQTIRQVRDGRSWRHVA